MVFLIQHFIIVSFVQECDDYEEKIEDSLKHKHHHEKEEEYGNVLPYYIATMFWPLIIRLFDVISRRLR